ncbi:hypothetical protein NE237_023037 [Protea cynaroides]|uniref:RNase H type-1 domain-containing protein n=1 Tax=Protea cynaroides TaxID=273540 RepID=A0A9Q0HE56_9MAGN|nr:hypothetical protein NE237_023037 [Protea cynaroides]
MFQVSNNATEYEALIAGLRLAKAIMAKRIEASSDSQLVVRQVNGEYEAKKASISAYLKKVQEAASAFEYFTLRHVLRDQNTLADSLSKLSTSDLNDLDHSVYTKVLSHLAVNPDSTVNPNSKAILSAISEPSWIDPIFSFLQEGTLPEDKKKARRIQSKATHYVMTSDASRFETAFGKEQKLKRGSKMSSNARICKFEAAFKSIQGSKLAENSKSNHQVGRFAAGLTQAKMKVSDEMRRREAEQNAETIMLLIFWGLR